MLHIPEDRENMSNVQLRKLVLDMADGFNARNGRWKIDKDSVEVESPVPSWSQVREAREPAKWAAGRLSGSLTNRAGIQWPLDKLDDAMRSEIMIDDPSLLGQPKEDS